jgi:hypothetical protein
MFSTTYKPFLSDLFHYCSKTKARLVGTCPDGVRLRAVRPLKDSSCPDIVIAKRGFGLRLERGLAAELIRLRRSA